jgi:hypothetical protein
MHHGRPRTTKRVRPALDDANSRAVGMGLQRQRETSGAGAGDQDVGGSGHSTSTTRDQSSGPAITDPPSIDVGSASN